MSEYLPAARKDLVSSEFSGAMLLSCQAVDVWGLVFLLCASVVPFLSVEELTFWPDACLSSHPFGGLFGFPILQRISFGYCATESLWVSAQIGGLF